MRKYTSAKMQKYDRMKTEKQEICHYTKKENNNSNNKKFT